MIVAVADTHALLWYLADHPRLSPKAKAVFEDAARRGARVGISAISLAEIVYLAEKGRIPPANAEVLLRTISAGDSLLQEIPLDSAIVARLTDVPRELVPDLPDRVIAATGVFLGIPVLSRDRKITASGIETIW
ncbi:MAG: type II toxin-antitoxin system VapC family toxin [Bryobacter sp.]|jgi:PIN domain nuclease of toxin-antitoxin system|nr:type II toxin-antitoxin system VapC family toxin [Bryobacter sp.]